MSYWRFFAMIGTSTLVMFGLMYLNTYLVTHIFFSETRAYMAVLMGATMAIIMLSFMLSMYRNRTANIAIFAVSVLVFAGSLWLVRSQMTVADSSYMRAMIPHHSIAIMTSKRANISDPRVRKLADEIIAAQEKEIAEMKFLIADLGGDEGAVPPASMSESPPEVTSVEEALARPAIGKLDAAGMDDAEIAEALPGGAGCRFLRTTDSPPILALEPGGEAGVMKLSGQLIELEPAPGSSMDAPAMTADGVSMSVMPLPDGGVSDADELEAADLVFDLDAGLTVHYRGWYGCEPAA